MPEVVEEFVTETFALMGAGHKTGHVKELYGDGAAAIDARAIVGFAAVGEVVTSAGAVNLEIADRTLRIDGGEARMETVQDYTALRWYMMGSAYGKLPADKSAPHPYGRGGRGRGRGLTDFRTRICQAVAMVSFHAKPRELKKYLLRVVDLPDDGLPTNPIRGSRGITRNGEGNICKPERNWGITHKTGQSSPSDLKVAKELFRGAENVSLFKKHLPFST